MSNWLIDPRESSLKELFATKDFLIPNFQRPFSWEKKNIKKILEDIKGNYELNPDEKYFVGAVYFCNSSIREMSERLEIIDGQQRLTFFYILGLMILQKLKALKQVNNDDDFSKKITQQIEFAKRHFSSSSANGDNKIISHGLDKNILNNIVDNFYNNSSTYSDSLKNLSEEEFGKVYHITINEINRFMNDNFGKLKSPDERTRFFKFLDFVYKKIVFLVIKFQDNNIPKILDVFIKINNTGKRLGEEDLIKSYIFKLYKVLYDEKKRDNPSIRCYKNKFADEWSNFIVKSKNKVLNFIDLTFKAFYKFSEKKMKYEYFKAIYEKLTKSEERDLIDHQEITNIEEMVDFLKSKLKSFHVLRNGFKLSGNQTTEEDIKNEINLYLKIIDFSKYEHPFSVLYLSIDKYLNQKLEISELLLIIKESFRFSLCFQTINLRDSKDSIPPFKNIVDGVNIMNKELSHQYVKSIFNLEGEKWRNQEELKIELMKVKEETKAKLALSKIIQLFANGPLMNANPQRHQVNDAINWFSGNVYHLDHIIPKKTPTTNNWEIIDNRENNKTFDIKIINHDWFKSFKETDIDNDNIIKHNIWTKKIINNFGNHQILSKEDNKSHQNKNKNHFSSFEDLSNREEKIIDDFLTNLFK